MIKEIIASGKDVMEAKENARLALGATELDDVQYEILHAGSKGIFGIIGVKPAQVKATMHIPDATPRRERRSHGDRQERRDGAASRKNNQPKPKAEPTVDTPAEETTGEATTRSTPRRKHKGGKHAPVEKAAAVFETELTFTPREVAPGEDKAYDFICTLVANLGLDVKVELLSCDDGTRRINVEGEAASILIGHHGETLDAVQYLANLACAQKNEKGERDKSRVTVNVEGYRAKREETLRTLARAMAAKALRTHRSVTLEPMSPYERRIIHSEVQGIEGVSTNSVGSENNRKVVIYLTDKKPKSADVAPEVDVVDVAPAAEDTTGSDTVSE